MKRFILSGVLVLCLFGCLAEETSSQQKKVRKAVVAGQFYPGSKTAVERQVQQYLEQAEQVEVEGQLRALVAPHAGYIYSGPIAGYAYKQIRKPFKRVFIFASSHSTDFDRLSVPAEFTHYETPLGEVPLSPVVQELVKEEGISYVPEAHTTHIIEVHLPFLQVLLEDFEIIPVITWRMNLEDIQRFVDLFSGYVDDDTLFIVSTDLSHYHPYNDAVRLDTSCVQALEQLDFQGVADSELCGKGAALILIEMAKKQGWQGKILDYRNSGDTAGDKDRVVGYSALGYYARIPLNPPLEKGETEPLSEEEQQVLLELAEAAVELYVKEQMVFEPEVDRFAEFPRLRESRGAFVTLKKQGQLRGCTGSLVGRAPLYLTVRDNAIKAAAEDPRFKPVTEEELAEITLSISVLDVPRPLEVASPQEYPEKLTHQDGVILVNGRYSATYLPQVWEQIPDTVEFLSQLCLKGGVRPDCWQDPDTQLYTYRAQEFGEGI